MSQIGALFGGLFGDAGQNFVDEQGGKSAVFGTKPQVADYVPVDLSAETGKAVSSNLDNFDSITQFLNKVVPGFSDLLTAGTSNALSELHGQLPQDVIDQIQRSTAFQSLVGGFSGTGAAKALTARDLGISSLNLTATGQNAAQSWIQSAETAYSPFTVSTSEQAGTTAANNAGIQANQQYKYNVAAAPDPGAAGVFNVDAALGQQLLSIGGSFLGGVGGGSGGSGGATAAVGGQSPFTLVGGQGNSPAYQYNSSTGQFGTVPVAQPVAQGAWSDRRIKSNIRYLRTSAQGHRVYRYTYGQGKIEFEGVIAQEVEKINPEAVYDGGDGYKRVNYNLLDVQFLRAA